MLRTEERLTTPAENPEAYHRSSPIPFEEAFYPEESHAYARDESLKDAFGRTACFFDRYLKEDQARLAAR